jgi:hypothetical protein
VLLLPLCFAILLLALVLPLLRACDSLRLKK